MREGRATRDAKYTPNRKTMNRLPDHLRVDPYLAVPTGGSRSHEGLERCRAIGLKAVVEGSAADVPGAEADFRLFKRDRLIIMPVVLLCCMCLRDHGAASPRERESEG